MPRLADGTATATAWDGAFNWCALRMLGFCPDDVTTTPAEAISFVARQLGVDPDALGDYGLRVQTRTDHANQVKAYLGFRSASPRDLEDVREWLAGEAVVQDRPIALFHLACQRLYELRLVRPGLTVIEQSLVGVAREAARQETARRVAPLLTDERCALLDSLLAVDAKLGAARATWLRHFPVSASPAVMHDEMDKLVFLQELGAGQWDLTILPARRRTTLAGWVQTASNQALQQSSAERRYPAGRPSALEPSTGTRTRRICLPATRPPGTKGHCSSPSDNRVAPSLRPTAIPSRAGPGSPIDEPPSCSRR